MVGSVVVTDLRHPRELEWFERRGFNTVTVRIEVDDAVRAQRGWVPDPEKDDHETETALDNKKDWGLIFDNSSDGTSSLKRWANNQFLVLAVNNIKM